MLLLGEISRLLGVDQLHIGTAGIGKLVGTKQEVLEIQKHIAEPPQKPGRKRNYLAFSKVPANPELHKLEEDWLDTKPVLPVSSGGLHPGIVPAVLDRVGTDIALQIGGGIHGHPAGSYAGAKAMRDAVEAYIDGISIEEKAKTSPELTQALKLWGKLKTR
jgi:ribulose-bisphosphate carboxylase large chain